MAAVFVLTTKDVTTLTKGVTTGSGLIILSLSSLIVLSLSSLIILSLSSPVDAAVLSVNKAVEGGDHDVTLEALTADILGLTEVEAAGSEEYQHLLHATKEQKEANVG